MWLGSSGPLLRGLPTIQHSAVTHDAGDQQPRLVAPARDVGALGHCPTSVPMASSPIRVASRTMSQDPSDADVLGQLALIEAESNAAS